LKCKSYFFVVSFQNSEAAQSIPISIILVWPAWLIAYLKSSKA
jgi:hypothetical protein